MEGPRSHSNPAPGIGTSIELTQVPQPVTLIRAESSVFDVAELWRFRELIYFLAWRDVKIRYKQTALGVAWVLLQPILTTIVVSVFFGKLAGFADRTGGVPYPVFALAGLIPWTFFANAVTNSGNSLVGSSTLITKVYFPRLAIPVAAIIAATLDLLLSLCVVVTLSVFYGIPPTPYLLLCPLILAGIVVTSTGLGTLVAALNVAFRDFKYVVPFALQLLLLTTPVIYPANLVPEQWRWVFSLNPLVGLIDGFRSALIGQSPHWPSLLISSSASLGLLAGGILYFCKVQDAFADVI